mmetsp:Transcript_68329/g.206582  ORF Transcript_68329/g.206582 Transcript_68329/m.206582 type:complete len:241 (-) Transcript_68329:84-806(-)
MLPMHSCATRPPPSHFDLPQPTPALVLPANSISCSCAMYSSSDMPERWASSLRESGSRPQTSLPAWPPALELLEDLATSLPRCGLSLAFDLSSCNFIICCRKLPSLRNSFSRGALARMSQQGWSKRNCSSAFLSGYAGRSESLSRCASRSRRDEVLELLSLCRRRRPPCLRRCRLRVRDLGLPGIDTGTTTALPGRRHAATRAGRPHCTRRAARGWGCWPSTANGDAAQLQGLRLAELTG